MPFTSPVNGIFLRIARASSGFAAIGVDLRTSIAATQKRAPGREYPARILLADRIRTGPRPGPADVASCKLHDGYSADNAECRYGVLDYLFKSLIFNGSVIGIGYAIRIGGNA